MGLNSEGWVVKEKNNLLNSMLHKASNQKNFLLEEQTSIAVITLNSEQILQVIKR